MGWRTHGPTGMDMDTPIRLVISQKWEIVDSKLENFLPKNGKFSLNFG